MLEKAARCSNIVQGIAALVFLYSFFHPATPSQQSIDPVVTPMSHPSWLPIAILVVAVIVSAVLNYLALRQRKNIEEVESSPPAGQGKPKWQRLQWANAERERLTQVVATMEGENREWQRKCEAQRTDKNGFQQE